MKVRIVSSSPFIGMAAEVLPMELPETDAKAAGLSVYGVYQGIGTFVFSTSRAELDAVPMYPVENALIKERYGVALYRLPNGELHITSPLNGVDKEYVYMWDKHISEQ